MRQEQVFKANKKAYYMELQNYHDKYSDFLSVSFFISEHFSVCIIFYFSRQYDWEAAVMEGKFGEL